MEEIYHAGDSAVAARLKHLSQCVVVQHAALVVNGDLVILGVGPANLDIVKGVESFLEEGGLD